MFVIYVCKVVKVDSLGISVVKVRYISIYLSNLKKLVICILYCKKYVSVFCSLVLFHFIGYQLLHFKHVREARMEWTAAKHVDTVFPTRRVTMKMVLVYKDVLMVSRHKTVKHVSDSRQIDWHLCFPFYKVVNEMFNCRKQTWFNNRGQKQ